MISSHVCCIIEGDDSPGEKQGKLLKTPILRVVFCVAGGK
jgi:hypothetical protein